jgi:DNA-binding beta-propeller fold protein YncE
MGEDITQRMRLLGRGETVVAGLAHAWRRRALLVLVGSLLTTLLSATPASALLQQGHVPAGAFGESAEVGATKPSAIAVNEASGEVYVLERANNRVMVYGPAPKHEFIEAWGFGVANGKEEFQRCQPPSKCLPGIAGYSREGEFDQPVALAVDNASGSPSQGDVYVVANDTFHKAAVEKFTANGELLKGLAIKNSEAEGPVDGVAVDPKGAVYVEREDEEEDFEILRYSNAEKNKLLDESELEVPEAFEGARPVRPGFAVDAQDDLYITFEPGGEEAEAIEEEETEIGEREKERKRLHEAPKDEKPAEQLDGACEAERCYVAKLSTRSAASGEGIEAFTLIPGVEDESPAAGIAVDQTTGKQTSGNVYLDQSDRAESQLDRLSALTADGALIQYLGEAQLEHGGGRGVAVNGARNELLVADEAAGRVDVFAPAPAGPPVVEPASLSAAFVTSSTAELRAQIDPDGAEARYHFEYGTGSCSASPSPCTSGPAGTLSGFGAQGITLKLAELAPSATYHFRVLVEHVAAGSPVLESEEALFTTQGSASEAALLDGRSWELVTPAAKHGSVILPLEEEGGLIEAAADGGSLAYITEGAGASEPEGERGPEPTEWIATRKQVGASGENTEWSSQDIATRNEAPSQGFDVGGPWEYQFFSSDLTSAFVDPYYPQSNVLLGGATERTPYIRENSTCVEGQESSCFMPILTAEDDTAEPEVSFANREAEKIETATPDLAHVVLGSTVPLTQAAAPTGGLYMFSPAKPAGERLQLISVLPGAGEVAAAGNVYAGGENRNDGRMAATAISADGSRVVWTAAGNPALDEAQHLYMTELGGEGTPVTSYKVDAVEPGVTEVAEIPAAEPLFQTATASGAQVFFTDRRALTENAVPFKGGITENAHSELYVFEPEQPEGERVKDIAPSLNAGESAEIEGGVLGAGEDSEGVTVYFVANGVLAPGAKPGDCHPTEADAALLSCNLYAVHYDRVSHAWEAPRFIRQLSDEDNPDWGGPHSTNSQFTLKHQTARVSPNGRYLAFMSDRSLTGYDNVDANSGARDEEVYLWDNNGSGSLVCASCNPDKAQPVGVFDEQYGTGEGPGLVVDRPQTWEPGTEVTSGTGEGDDPWLAGSLPSWTLVGNHETYYQSRYLSNEGRLFFNSADALTHVAKPTRTEVIDGVKHTVGVENVYEYEQQGVGSCAAANTEGGCVALISSGESEHESAFLDASNNGEDVYFLTSQPLVSQDTDTEFDIYDARVCKLAGAEPCASAPAPVQAGCVGEACKAPAPAPPSFQAPASSSSGGTGNIVPSQGALASKVVQKPKPTQAQLLAKALKACKKDKHKAKRVACEKQARKRYPLKKAKTGAKRSSVSSREARSGGRS